MINFFILCSALAWGSWTNALELNIHDSKASVIESSKIKSGDEVYANNGNDLVGTVTQIFGGKKARVHWTKLGGKDHSGISVWSCTSLSKRVLDGCERGICEGDTVYWDNGNDLVGKVVKVFANQKVEVKWREKNGKDDYDSGQYDYRTAGSLSAQVTGGCLDGICEGDVVYGDNGNDLIGEALVIFKNQKVKLKWTEKNGKPYDSGFYNYWSTGSLEVLSTGCSSC